MFGYRVNEAKSKFFDRKPVIDATDRATRKVLSRFGAFVRTRARSSMRRRKGASRAGEPPSAHMGFLKQFLYFAYESARRSVVIGPAKIGAKGEHVPETLEKGGESKLMFRQFRKRDGRTTVLKKMRSVQIAPRPFMQPAFDKELPGVPAMWAGAIKP